MNEKRVIESLRNWDSLNKVINQMNEVEVKTALDIEIKNSKRKQFILRLHRRFCMLRNKRERKLLLEAAA